MKTILMFIGCLAVPILIILIVILIDIMRRASPFHVAKETPGSLRRKHPEHRKFQPERLEKLGLPILEIPSDLARGLGFTWPQLVWLSGFFKTEERRRFHYYILKVPKRSGGMRELHAPKKHLRRAQLWILRNILDRLPPSKQSHGFIKHRSTRSNAEPHVGREIIVKLDLVDFFPSITYRRVRGIFHAMGYSRVVARLLALLCTVPADIPKVGRRRQHRFLPQGAPTSPALSNLACRWLDRRLDGLAKKFNATYTRYADDLTFSGDRQFAHELPKFFKMATFIIKKEGFAINWPKRRVIRKGSRQIVTGVVVNSRPTLPREERRLLRAMVHRLQSTGDFNAPAEVSDKHAWLRGRLAYYRMIDEAAGERLWLEYLRGRAA